jgi:tetratricopeptide (TPR) repeat protein
MFQGGCPIIRLLLFVFMLFLPSIPMSAIDYYSTESIVMFADWLFDQGDWERAAGEYLKASILLQGKAGREDVAFKLGRSYLKAGDFAHAESSLSAFISDYPLSKNASSAAFDLAFVFFKEQKYDESIRTLSTFKPANDEVFLRSKLLEATERCLLDDWESARKIIEEPLEPDSSKLQETKSELGKLSIAARSKNEKSPVAAGILALIPGLGKLYAGRGEDALFSFITIGTFAGLSAWSFYKDGLPSPGGWIYASIGTIFYAGSIYGSIEAALQFNQAQDESIRSRLTSVGVSLAQ